MKTIMITGATGDIGIAIVSKLASGGNRIIAAVRNKEQCHTLESMNNIEIYEADVTERDDIERLAHDIKGGVDWIIASHGYIDSQTDIIAQKPEAIAKTFDVNTLSLFSIFQTFSSHLSQGMIFISSMAGIHPNGMIIAYSASKAAVNAFAEALAKNQPRKTFIALCPGAVRGKMREKIGVTGGQDPMLVADLVCDMMSEKSVYKSGDVVSIKNGIVKVEKQIS